MDAVFRGAGRGRRLAGPIIVGRLFVYLYVAVLVEAGEVGGIRTIFPSVLSPSLSSELSSCWGLDEDTLLLADILGLMKGLKDI